MIKQIFYTARNKRNSEPALQSSVHGSATSTRGRRIISYPKADRIAFAAGMTLALLLASFFTWRMVENLTRDRALGPVPASTPTPPPPVRN